MVVTTEESVTDQATSAISDERKKALRDELEDLIQQKQQKIDTANEAMAAVECIKVREKEIMEELLRNKSTEPDDLELTPAMVDETITILKAEFNKDPDDRKKAGYRVQEGINFSAVEKKLRAKENEEKLKAVYRMVQEGSCPAVVCEEDGMFCIAETFRETLPHRANCVYDREAEKQVGEKKCNGNAVDQARKRGVLLMQRRIAKDYIIEFPDRKQRCYDYIQATTKERESGDAPYVFRHGGLVSVVTSNARSHTDNRGWRGEIWV